MIRLLVLLMLTGCAGLQTHLNDDRNMATMPVDQLVMELARPV